MKAIPFVEQADRALVLYANRLTGRNVAFDKVVFDIADSSFLAGGVFLAIYLWLWFETDEKGVHLQRRNIVVGLMAAVLVGVVSRFLQVLLPFHRMPLASPDLGLRAPLGIDSASLNNFSSLPSNHAALFFALSVPLWMHSRWLGAAATAWIVLVICLPLLYLGYHWPSDLIAGAVLGMVLMLLLSRLIGATGIPDRIVRASSSHPQTFYTVAWLIILEIALLFPEVQAFLPDVARLARTFI
jgi:undecaprenyl-diphosphatase